ncbi:hypothetical protein MMAGJ_34820 [Mycolicibacterium mageritense]|uniref:Uncharacterized protein n=1 Tax=Mycolicibacterium mageritense TaxID=53462 RepID=A0ABN5Y9E9_MYCME|nr:hypothetical protein MMAGJ_34820 [Mycolicibacterium mageritense]
MQVRPRRIGRVGDPVTLENLVVRDPHTTAGPRSGTSIVRRLLDDYCRETLVGSCEGGDHAGSAAADYDNVVLLSSHVEHVIELPGLWTTAPVKEARGIHQNA